MKKLFILVAIIVVCCFAFAGCGETKSSDTKTSTANELVGGVSKADIQKAMLNYYANTIVYKNSEPKNYDTFSFAYTFRFFDNNTVQEWSYYSECYAILETASNRYVLCAKIQDGAIVNVSHSL